jgi:hypothetical protein
VKSAEASPSSPAKEKEIEPQASVPAVSRPQERIDRYGWRVPAVEISKKELQLQKKDEEREERQEKKWMEMTCNLIIWQKLGTSSIQKRVLKGIPDTMRSRAWWHLLDPVDEAEISRRPSIAQLIARGRARCCDTIEVDLRRTFPRMVDFSKAATVDSLRDVLHAYSNYDPELGYIQGMAFIAGMFLCYLEERRAFWCFQKLMNGPIFRYGMVYRDGFKGLSQLFEVWGWILAQIYPKIAKHFNDCRIEAHHYAAGWFLTGFMNSDFPTNVRLNIFDRILAFGFRAVLSFGLVIFSRNKKFLARAHFTECVSLLQKAELCDSCQDWRYLLRKYDKLWISQDLYRSAFAELNIPYFF